MTTKEQLRDALNEVGVPENLHELFSVDEVNGEVLCEDEDQIKEIALQYGDKAYGEVFTPQDLLDTIYSRL